MAPVTVDQILVWQGIVTQLVGMGVKSFTAVKAVMQDAGADDATIAALQPKWDALVDDVRRAAGK
jgi:hypothetical protein